MDRQALPALRHCYLCSGMTGEQILQFMDLAPGTIKLYEKGSLVFQQGDKPERLFVLIKGKACISRDTLAGKRLLIATIDRPGDVFGEVYLFIEEPYEVQAEAEERSVVLELPGTAFTAGTAAPAALGNLLKNNLLRVFAGKAYTLSNRVRVLGCGSIREKIAQYLLQRHSDGPGGVPSREQMAEYMNVARPSLSRELSRMQEEGIIELSGREITVKDQERLESYL